MRPEQLDGSIVEFQFNELHEGSYDVFATWPSHESRTHEAIFHVGNGAAVFTPESIVDQFMIDEIVNTVVSTDFANDHHNGNLVGQQDWVADSDPTTANYIPISDASTVLGSRVIDGIDFSDRSRLALGSAVPSQTLATSTATELMISWLAPFMLTPYGCYSLTMTVP